MSARVKPPPKNGEIKPIRCGTKKPARFSIQKFLAGPRTSKKEGGYFKFIVCCGNQGTLKKPSHVFQISDKVCIKMAIKAHTSSKIIQFLFQWVADGTVLALAVHPMGDDLP